MKKVKTTKAKKLKKPPNAVVVNPQDEVHLGVFYGIPLIGHKRTPINKAIRI